MRRTTAGSDIVVPIELGVDLDVGAPFPTLVTSDYATMLLIWLSDLDRSGHQTGILTWIDCVGTRLGWPNEEDFHRHPLYERGLQKVLYGAGEVLNSSWVAELAHLPGRSPETPFRHFIMPFVDTTFECIARGYEVATDPRPMAHVFADQFPWPKK